MSRTPLLFASMLLVCSLLAGCASAGRSLELLSGSALVYPPDARAAGVEGHVLVAYDIDGAGRVVNARVIEAEPVGVFEQAAMASVTSWRFRPASDTGEQQVIEGVQSRIDFTLGAGDAYRDY